MKKGIDYIGVGVGACIVNHRNEVLLLHRLKNPEKGSWTIPGGRVELGETIEEAVIREAKEEIGVDIKIWNLLGVTNYIDIAKKDHWVAPVFFAEIVTGKPRNREPSTHKEMKWFPIDNVPKNLTIMTIFALDKYKQTNPILEAERNE